MINPAYNYNHYKSQRSHDGKILKRSLYGLLDNAETLMQQLTKKLAEDEIRYKKSCEYLDNAFKK
jgi:hypothetical protein